MCEQLTSQRQCRCCGCTDNDACQVNGVACCWIDEELCSACAGIEDIVNTLAGQAWLVKLLEATKQQFDAGQLPSGHVACNADYLMDRFPIDVDLDDREGLA